LQATFARGAGHGHWLTVVERFQLGEFFQVILQQVCELPEQAPRAEGVMSAQKPSSSARRAARTTRSISYWSPSATWARSSLSAGL
jgi:hypothetical protein